jgi:uncharacterized membrane protein YedE/YeeE
MNLTNLIERFGEPTVLALGGLFIGALFGFFAQRSKFCLRAATLEFWHWRFGEKIAVWLLTFSTAVVGVQVLTLLHHMDASATRQIAATGSLSGAIVGGLLFGAGMVLTRGCASRLLVLSANGNLRALLSGLIFAVTAQASLGGALAPWREAISSWWVVSGGDSRNLLAITHTGTWGGLLFGMTWLIAALYFSIKSGWGLWKWVGGVGAGAAVALAWNFNYEVARASFEIVPIQGMTFSGPSAEWLMRVVASPDLDIGFNFGMLPGVFIGSLAGAWVGRELKLEGFKDGYSMRRYIVGAIFMGFGAMLAGGCAVGAGITGGAIFALTAWVALACMWVGAALADRLIDAPEAQQRPHADPIRKAP